MKTMKRVNRLLWLGLLALLTAAAPAAMAQKLNPMTIGTSLPGATYFVDGQRYTETTVFTWAEGTSHVVQFPFSVDQNGILDVQYLTYGSRYRFHGWTKTYAGPDPGDFADEIEVVVASSQFTSLIANLTIEYRVRLNFPQSFASNYCQEFITNDQPTNTIDLDRKSTRLNSSH